MTRIVNVGNSYGALLTRCFDLRQSRTDMVGNTDVLVAGTGTPSALDATTGQAFDGTFNLVWNKSSNAYGDGYAHALSTVEVIFRRTGSITGGIIVENGYQASPTAGDPGWMLWVSGSPDALDYTGDNQSVNQEVATDFTTLADTDRHRLLIARGDHAVAIYIDGNTTPLYQNASWWNVGNNANVGANSFFVIGGHYDNSNRVNNIQIEQVRIYNGFQASSSDVSTLWGTAGAGLDQIYTNAGSGAASVARRHHGG